MSSSWAVIISPCLVVWKMGSNRDSNKPEIVWIPKQSKQCNGMSWGLWNAAHMSFNQTPVMKSFWSRWSLNYLCWGDQRMQECMVIFEWFPRTKACVHCLGGKSSKTLVELTAGPWKKDSHLEDDPASFWCNGGPYFQGFPSLLVLGRQNISLHFHLHLLR